jgi:hypothetical protein
VREFIANLKAAVREMLRPTFPEDPDPQSTADQVAARTAWIRDHRPPDGR